MAQNKKIAIVHDWLVGGGAEQVVLALHELYPEAPIYTSYCTDEWRQKLDGKVVTGYLQKWPFSKLRKFLPVLRFRWFENLDLTEYDLIISSSGNGEAKSIKKLKSDALHICYCHTPTHFYWAKYEEYLKSPGFGIFNPLARLGLRTLVEPLRKRDIKAASQPDFFIANSTHIKNSIKKYYGRDSEVIHPPVDINRFTKYDLRNTKQTRQGFVTAGRQTPYKRIDIIVEACTKLNIPLKVLGSGPEHNKLKRLAGPTIEFVKQATNQQIEEALASAEAFIFAANEDFGITPVEALASGTPVIAYRAGDALDYVNKLSGLFYKEQTVDSLVTALSRFNAKNYSDKELKKQAQKFSREVFKKKLHQFINSKDL